MMNVPVSASAARVIAFGLLAGAGFTHAHVTLETRSAPVESHYKAVFVVGHGCDGQQATHTVKIQLPAGLRGAKPMPKPGWTLTVRRDKLAEPYKSHGREVTEDVTEITWSASSAEFHLSDAHVDEFALRGQLPAAPGLLWFKVQQLCPSGQLNWFDIPASGTDTKGLKTPAVLLEVTPLVKVGEHAHH